MVPTCLENCWNWCVIPGNCIEKHFALKTAIFHGKVLENMGIVLKNEKMNMQNRLFSCFATKFNNANPYLVITEFGVWTGFDTDLLCIFVILTFLRTYLAPDLTTIYLNWNRLALPLFPGRIGSVCCHSWDCVPDTTWTVTIPVTQLPTHLGVVGNKKS